MNQDIYVNHKLIPEEMIGQEMQYHPAQSKQEAWQKAAEALVLRELLLQEAYKQKVAGVDNDEAQLIDDLLAQMIVVPPAEDAECLAFYQAQAHRFLDEQGQALAYADVMPLIKIELAARAGRQALNVYLTSLVAQSDLKGLVMGKAWLPVRMMS